MRLLLLFFLCCAAQAAPKVVVTIKPIHSLVASLMEGVAEPELLLPDGASPHTFQLKPSHLQKLQQADIIIWIGPQLELFMTKPLEQIHPRLGLITLSENPQIHTLPQRQGRHWQSVDHTHDHHDHHAIDPHFWLSTENAQVIIQSLSVFLAKEDPTHQAQYFANAQKISTRLNHLKRTLHTLLSPVKNQPFLVYHDGYQYFEKEFQLNALGTMIVNPHLPLSAFGLRAIKQLIEEKHIKCVFRETEFNDKVIKESLHDLPVTVAELDPLGARIAKGPENYEKTMLKLGENIQECLSH